MIKVGDRVRVWNRTHYVEGKVTNVNIRCGITLKPMLRLDNGVIGYMSTAILLEAG